MGATWARHAMCESAFSVTKIGTYKYINHSFIHSSSIHSLVCRTSGPLPLPKLFPDRLPSSASSFNVQHSLVSVKSSSSCLRLLSRLPLTSVLPSIFPSITCFKGQFLRQMRPIQLVFLVFIICRIVLSSLTLCNTSFLTQSIQLIYIGSTRL